MISLSLIQRLMHHLRSFNHVDTFIALERVNVDYVRVHIVSTLRHRYHSCIDYAIQAHRIAFAAMIRREQWEMH